MCSNTTNDHMCMYNMPDAWGLQNVFYVAENPLKQSTVTFQRGSVAELLCPLGNLNYCVNRVKSKVGFKSYVKPKSTYVMKHVLNWWEGIRKGKWELQDKDCPFKIFSFDLFCLINLDTFLQWFHNFNDRTAAGKNFIFNNNCICIHITIRTCNEK